MLASVSHEYWLEDGDNVAKWEEWKALNSGKTREVVGVQPKLLYRLIGSTVGKYFGIM